MRTIHLAENKHLSWKTKRKEKWDRNGNGILDKTLSDVSLVSMTSSSPNNHHPFFVVVPYRLGTILSYFFLDVTLEIRQKCLDHHH